MKGPLPRRMASILVLTALGACGGSEPPATDGGSAGAPSMSGPRIPVAPTAADQLPSAILGQAGPLMGTELQYVDGDTVTTGYLAVPDGAGPFPGLVIIHQWNGLVDRVREVADDFAREGYVTLAVDLFSGRVGANPDENRALMAEVAADQPKMIANLDAAVAYLKGRSDVNGRVGAMGWCYGGGVALSFGLDGAEHEATAIFYGSLIDDPARLANLHHEVYGTFAEMDGGIPPEAVARFGDALRAAGIESDLHVYDGMTHGFWLSVDQDAERAAPALDAWQRLKAYLDRTLRAG